MKRNDVGMRVGSLVVTKDLGIFPYGNAKRRMYEVRCDCGKVFTTYSYDITRKDWKRKSSCGCEHKSSAERRAIVEFEKANIKFTNSWRPEDFRYEDTKAKCEVDFLLPNFNTVIEMDGQQHFKSVEYFGGNKAFEKVQEHDRLKNEYFRKKGYIIIRIPYTHYNKITLDDLLPETSKFIVF